MKKFFAIATMVTLIAVGCKKDKLPEPELKLTSQSAMSFDAAGGTGTITYKLTNPDKTTKVEATADGTWISAISTTTAGQVGFTVAANESADARSAKMTVKYGVKSFEVAINQAGMSGEPGPGEAEVIEFDSAMDIEAVYLGDFMETGYGDWEIEALPADGTGWGIDMEVYSDVVGFNPTANFNGSFINFLEDDMAEGAYYAAFIFYCENGQQTGERLPITSGNLVVSHDSEGNTNLSINGNYIIDWTVQLNWQNQSGEPTNVEAQYLTYASYGAHGSYYFIIGGSKPTSVNEDGQILLDVNTHNYAFLLCSSEPAYDKHSFQIPAGKYTFDANDTFSPLYSGDSIGMPDTFSKAYSLYMWSDEGDGELFGYTDGTINITEEGITANITLENGEIHNVTYTGSTFWGEVFDGVMDPATAPFIGNFTAKFENSYSYVEGEEGFAIQLTGEPMERDITIAPYTGPGATGMELLITGWSINEEYFDQSLPMIAEVSSRNGELKLSSGATLKVLDNERILFWSTIIDDGEKIYATISDDVVYRIDPNTLTASTQIDRYEDEYEQVDLHLIGLEVYALSAINLHFYTQGPHPAGNFTLVRKEGNQSVATAKKQGFKIPAPIGTLRPYNKPTSQK